MGQAMVYVFTGLYGQPSDLGAGVVFLLILQLVIAGLVRLGFLFIMSIVLIHNIDCHPSR